MTGFSPTVEQALQTALLEDSPAAGPACPPADRLWDALEGSLPPDESERLVLHAGACPACGVGLRVARELLRERDGSASPLLAPLSPPRLARRVPWPWLFAGTGTLLTAAALVLWPQPQPALRGAGGTSPLRALSAEGRTGREGLVLRWSALPGARYSVRLFTAGLVLVHQQAALTQEELLVPASALRSLPGGARLVWTVSARLPDGRAVTSPAYLLELE